MRHLITADLHLRNDRPDEAEWTLAVLYRVARDKGAGNIIIAGDLGHTDYWGAALMDVVVRGFGCITMHGITVTIIGGNHDLDKHGNFTIPILTGMRNVNPITMPDTDKDFAYIPYSKSMDFLSSLRKDKHFKNKRAMFFHCGFKGGKVGGADWVLKADLSAKRVFKWFSPDMIIAGHYHKPQRFYSKAYYVGSPRQHTFNEEGEGKRVFLLTKKSLISIPLKDYFSEHITLCMKKANKIPIWKNMDYHPHRIPIYRIIVPRPEWVTSVRKMWTAYKGRWSIVFERTGSVEEHGEVRSDIRPTDSYAELVNKYVEHKHPSGSKRLIKTGMEIVEVVQ